MTQASDRLFLENLATVENLEEKRELKQGQKARAPAVNVEEPDKTNMSSSTSEIKLIIEGMKILQASVSSLQEEVRRPPNRQGKTKQWSGERTKGCPACKTAGKGDHCHHCFKCGGDNHFDRGCRSKPQGNESRLRQGTWRNQSIN